MNIPHILFLEPNRVWRTYPGGKKLDIMEGKANPQDAHFPEDWIGSTTRAVNKGREDIVEGLSNVTVDGETLTLKALCEKYPCLMLGAAHVAKYGATTQFLLKFLDSAIRLHIQCHPTIPFAQKYLNSNAGKTEAYVILGIREEVKEPYIYMGFQHPPKPEDFKRMIEEQDTEAILACFDKVPIKPGDVFMVPGGMPHAIGEGVFMIEIMEPTDFAVRIEFERGGYVLPEASRFMNRGVDFAISMFNFDASPIDLLKQKFFCEPKLLEKQNDSAEYSIIDESKTACFRVNRIQVKDRFVKKSDSFYTGIVSQGSGTLRIGSETYPLKQYTKFFVPYQTGAIILESETGMEITATFPPKSDRVI
ncbi:MAG: mannose-6-phosphate isomerase [Kiritimatiellaceae bacterium]|nr:mannose-6-phosphate isomerase [Kiritimatiellaceae bacterium]